jgi:hypothetical protein
MWFISDRARYGTSLDEPALRQLMYAAAVPDKKGNYIFPQKISHLKLPSARVEQAT